MKLANCLTQYQSSKLGVDPVLIVDDVWTTGDSVFSFISGEKYDPTLCKVWTVFARNVIFNPKIHSLMSWNYLFGMTGAPVLKEINVERPLVSKLEELLNHWGEEGAVDGELTLKIDANDPLAPELLSMLRDRIELMKHRSKE